MTSRVGSGVYFPEQVIGLVLAGGAGRRMGGVDKGLIELDNRPLVQWVVDALRPQVASLLISANRNQERYTELGWPVIADDRTLCQGSSSAPYQGPLAGIATALAQIKIEADQRPAQTEPYPHSHRQSRVKPGPDPAWLLISPCDTPLIPLDLGQRLAAVLEAQKARIAIAADQNRSQPLHALIPTDIGNDLDDYLGSGGRSVVGWLNRHKVATATFDQTPSPFRNLNQPVDAESLHAQIDMARRLYRK